MTNLFHIGAVNAPRLPVTKAKRGPAGVNAPGLGPPLEAMPVEVQTFEALQRGVGALADIPFQQLTLRALNVGAFPSASQWVSFTRLRMILNASLGHEGIQ
jgi:hypothetical protein